MSHHEAATATIGPAGPINLLVAILTAWVAAGITIGGPDSQPLPGSWSLVLLLVPGGALLLAGIVAAPRARGVDPAAAILLQATAVLWFLTGWNDPSAVAWVFVLGRLSSWVCPVVAAHAVLRWQGGLRPVEVGGLALGYLDTAVLAGLVPVLFAEPRLAGCGDCPPDPLLIRDTAPLAEAASWVAVWGGIAWCAILIVAQVGRMRRYSSVKRRFDGPIAIAGIAVCVISLVGSVESLLPSGTGPADIDVRLWIGLGAAVTAVALGVMWPLIAIRLTRIRLTGLLIEAATGDLSTKLGQVIDDPTAQLLYPVPGGSIVDVHGRAASPPSSPGAVLTSLERGGIIVAYLAHNRNTLDTGGQVTDEITRATRLMLDSERLHAERSWHLRQLQESRRRLVAEADHTRRDLERDLHDGAQQNLVALSIALSVAELRAATPERAAVLHHAGAEVSAALTELRLVARGIFPRELGDEGITAALELLAESAASPVTTTVDLPQRPPIEVEAAAYFAIRAALGRQLAGTTGPATIDLRRAASPDWKDSSESGPQVLDWLTVDIRTDVLPSDTIAIEDRVGAVGGRVTMSTNPAGSCLRLELPCGS